MQGYGPRMRLSATDLRRFVTAIFAAAGCSEREASRIAERLVEANLVGHDSHGLVRCQQYVESLRTGRVVADRTIEVLFETDAMAIVDANYGFGQTVGEQAVRLGVDKATAAGVAVVALRRAGHLGRIGDWAEQAAASSVASIHFVNLSNGPLVAPFGGTEKRMATNPVCIGVPRPDGAPLVLDFATSIVAEGKVLVAAKGGKPLPEGVIVRADGERSNDPADFYGPLQPGERPNPRTGPGALVAMGGHKGSGLSFMCELLGGALTGSGCAGPLGRHEVANGMLSIYLSIDAFDRGSGFFAAELQSYVDWFASARPEPGGEVLTPGEPERRRKAERLVEGIDLPEETWESILSAARRAGLDDGAIAALLPGPIEG